MNVRIVLIAVVRMRTVLIPKVATTAHALPDTLEMAPTALV